MTWQITLNDKVIVEGDFKTLSVLFDSLSGLHFAKSKNSSSWLDKMSSTESYQHYLAIKAKELGVIWSGQLSLCQQDTPPTRVHLFDQHASLLAQTNSANKSAL